MATHENTAPDALHTLARTHLPPDMADRWTGLLRPAAHLRAAGPGDPVVGQLGGLPRLPESIEWPVWEGYGPLSFVAVVDCAALPVDELDIPLRPEGRLAFFSFEDEEGEAVVDTCDPDTWAGARLLHLPSEAADLPERPAPEGLTPYRAVPLTAKVAPSAPDSESLVLNAEFGLGALSVKELFAHPVRCATFMEALWDHQGTVAHQIGGHAQNVQGPVEVWAAKAVLGDEVDWEDPRIEEEAARWVLLAQFDSDEDTGMMWADGGVLYWLIRPEDLAAGRFEAAMFTWQSG
ncbi:YwqG family protein [Streptomyces sp. NPDC048636]|uniref:YwqG family protein n=1 Tax=Streptomyces sp. NPDC048636 TaxID=3155762 RepID=UPI00343F469A